MLQLIKSLSFHIPEAWKRCPFRTAPPRKGHNGGGGGERRLTTGNYKWVVTLVRQLVEPQTWWAIHFVCPPFVAPDKTITVVGIFIVSIGFSIAKMSQSYKKNLLLDLLLDQSFRSPHVNNSKTVLHSGFHAVHSRIKVLHSGFFVSGT